MVCCEFFRNGRHPSGLLLYPGLDLSLDQRLRDGPAASDYTCSMQVCPNCGEENPDRFRLCGICGMQLMQAALAEEVRKTVSIVFSDLVGSTDLAEQLDTESLREILNAYFTEMKAVLERHGGTVEKFIGDAIMAVFGLPKLHEDDALRAVRAAFEMRRSLEQVNARLEAGWGVRLHNRTGVNSGEVIAGDVTAGQWLVTGGAVNTVARLEQNAPTDEVLIGDATYRLVKDAVNVERVGPLDLKGKADRVPAYLLRGVKAADEGISRRLDVSMVGRQRELKALMDALGRAMEDRKGQLVTVFGSAGVGKTRLLREFVTLPGEQPTTLRGHCLSYGDGITFWPLAEVIRQAAAIAEDDPLQLARGKLFGLAGDEVSDAMERVAAVIGLSSENYPLQETFWGVRRLLESLAGERPLVVVVEDIHWAEQTLLDLLEYVAAEATAPIMLVCSARPELLEAHDDWAQDRERVQHLGLTPLSEDESRRVIENLLGTTAFDERLAARVIEAAEGNPLFVEQMLSMLIHDGIVARDDADGWTLTSNIRAVTVPPSISALLSARLDRLGSSERAVMERGAVIGQSFFRSAVEALSSTEVRERLDETLASLVRKELIHDDRSQFAGHETYRFLHALIRDAAYHGLRKRTRAELHARFVDWIERTLPDRMIELEEIRGYHLEQAYLILVQLARADEHVVGLGARGASCLSSAGRRALARGDLPAASDLLQRAAALLPSTDQRHPRLLLEAGEALMETGEFPLAEAVLNAGIQGAATLEDQALELTGRMILVDLRHTTSLGNTDEEVMAQAEHALPILADLGDHEGQARAWRLIMQVNWEACRWGASESAAEKMIEHARLAGDTVLEARALPALATCALYGPRPVPEAIELCRRLLQRTGSDCKATAVTTRTLAHLEAMRGNFDLARDLYRKSRASLLEFGWKLHAAVTSHSSGPIEMLAGDPAAAEAELRRDYRALQEMGENYHLSTTAAFLAEALFEQGQLEKAERFTRASEELATEGDITSQFLWRTVRGKILAHQGHVAAGAILVRQALDLIATAEEPDSEASAFLDLAEVLALEQKLEQARQALERAVALFEVKGNIVSSQRVRERLTALSPTDQRLRRAHRN
jgi:predicted ATPase/class 3 adenylate cyclase